MEFVRSIFKKATWFNSSGVGSIRATARGPIARARDAQKYLSAKILDVFSFHSTLLHDEKVCSRLVLKYAERRLFTALH